MKDRLRLAFLLAAFLLLLVNCGGVKRQPTSETLPPAKKESPDVTPDEIVTEGRLKRTVEEGGWVLETASKTYLLLGIEPSENESQLKEGVRVRVKGKEDPTAITIFMQGTPFRVRELEIITP